MGMVGFIQAAARGSSVAAAPGFRTTRSAVYVARARSFPGNKARDEWK